VSRRNEKRQGVREKTCTLHVTAPALIASGAATDETSIDKKTGASAAAIGQRHIGFYALTPPSAPVTRNLRVGKEGAAGPKCKEWPRREGPDGPKKIGRPDPRRDSCNEVGKSVAAPSRPYGEQAFAFFLFYLSGWGRGVFCRTASRLTTKCPRSRGRKTVVLVLDRTYVDGLSRGKTLGGGHALKIAGRGGAGIVGAVLKRVSSACCCV